MKKIFIDYFFELYEKNSIPVLFSKVKSANHKEGFINPEYNPKAVNITNKVYSIFFIPDYFLPVIEKDTFTIKRIPQFFKGYAIFLEGFDSVDAYIKKRFRSNAKTIRRRVKRLESCFEVSYKTYLGHIDQEEYDFFMDCLKKMLIRRFDERNDTSQTLLNWEHYKKMYFSLINEKRASLFVALEKDKPIIVSLNHHFNRRLFSAISSYDIDYAKFSLGSVEIYKKLDWLIENKYLSYEMGMGDLTYKREWCNHIYNFEHQILYPKKNLRGWIIGNIEYIKVQIKEFIYKIAYVRYKNFKAKQKKTVEQRLTPQVYDITDVQETEKKLPIVDYNSKENSFLRRLVFDFIYVGIEKATDVTVHQISDGKSKSYWIIGKSKMQKITVTI